MSGATYRTLRMWESVRPYFFVRVCFRRFVLSCRDASSVPLHSACKRPRTCSQKPGKPRTAWRVACSSPRERRRRRRPRGRWRGRSSRRPTSPRRCERERGGRAARAQVVLFAPPPRSAREACGSVLVHGNWWLSCVLPPTRPYPVTCSVPLRFALLFFLFCVAGVACLCLCI